MKIRVGIYGYGNLGRGVEAALRQNEDMETVGVFTRRAPGDLKTLTGIPVFAADSAPSMTDKIDVMILCGGSRTDLPVQTPALAAHFNVVDSFDTHAKIPAHLAAVDAAAHSAGKTAVISVGWDPGMFSLQRMLGGAILPVGED
ncbi:MAG: diaminopimelate dehydrogenase, partial [Clostridia bacterium]|nr:diaminopimelate dehydrogenase [Clostridia bacterium]